MNIFLIITLVLLVIFAIVISIANKLIGKVWALLSGIIIGIVMLIIFIFIKDSIAIENVNQTNKIISMPISIFINLIMIAIPFFLFFIVSSLVFSKHFSDIKKKTYGISFLNLLSLSLFGIIMAMLMIPLILLIPDSMWNFSSSINGQDNSEGISWLWILFLVIVIVSFSYSLIIRSFLSDKIDSFRKWTNYILEYITKYFAIVIFFVPIIIMLQLSSIGLSEQEFNSIGLLVIYMGVFWIGGMFIFFILFTADLLLSTKDLTIRERGTILLEQISTVFANQSTAASLPTTQKNVKKLGVCEEISKLTPTKGVFMGMVMCNGFAPMLIVEFTLASAGMLNILNIFLVGIIILSLAVSTSGAGSADYFIITTTISMISGISTDLYLSIIMPGQEINERTITRPNNTLGHVYATLVTEKYHNKTGRCDCESHIE